MPYAPAALVVKAVSSLEDTHPLAVVTLPALLQAAHEAGVDPTVDLVPFGGPEESALLKSYFQLPRPPSLDRPFFAPWASSGGESRWQTKKYPGGGLQRMRTDLSGRGQVLRLLKDKPRDRWGLTPTAGKELTGAGGKASGFEQVRLIDLALWFGRDVDIATLPQHSSGASDIDRLYAWFLDRFAPKVGDLVGTVYSDGIPSEYRASPFEAAPVGDETYEALGSMPPAPTVSIALDELVMRLEASLEADGFVLPTGLVRRVLTAWMRGDIVVLVGQPGTGKSLFANLLGHALSDELDLEIPVVIPVRSDFDEAEFIGYERLNGTPQLREFATAVLKSDSPLNARVVVLEEFNLAPVETYLAAVLVATQDKERIVRLPGDERVSLPIDTFILATCNSYRDEPETRVRVSSPTKRRSTIVTMPNVLSDRFEDEGDEVILELALERIQSETRRVLERIQASTSAQFDSLRLHGLQSVTDLTSLSPEVRTALVRVTTAILDTTTGRSWFTLGLLRDVALAVALAPRDSLEEMRALGQAVADKLIHQVRGPHSDVQELEAACADLPNAEEIGQLLARASDGPSEELLPLL